MLLERNTELSCYSALRSTFLCSRRSVGLIVNVVTFRVRRIISRGEWKQAITQFRRFDLDVCDIRYHDCIHHWEGDLQEPVGLEIELYINVNLYEASKNGSGLRLTNKALELKKKRKRTIF